MCILLLVCCGTLVEVAAASQQDRSISRATIPMDPAAAKVFPSSQFSPACAIISIEGLGPLDGDYVLVDELTEMNGTPAWIGALTGTRQWLLSWQIDERVWAIEVYGLRTPTFRAFVEGASSVPPSRSSRWKMYSKSASVFEEVENVVSIVCPGKSSPQRSYASLLRTVLRTSDFRTQRVYVIRGGQNYSIRSGCSLMAYQPFARSGSAQQYDY